MKVLSLVAGLIAVATLGTATAAEPKPNILFIAVDDLRPQMGCYGQREPHAEPPGVRRAMPATPHDAEPVGTRNCDPGESCGMPSCLESPVFCAASTQSDRSPASPVPGATAQT